MGGGGGSGGSCGGGGDGGGVCTLKNSGSAGSRAIER